MAPGRLSLYYSNLILNPFLFPFFSNFLLLLFCSQFGGQEPKKRRHQLPGRGSCRVRVRVFSISTVILWMLSSLNTPASPSATAKIKKSNGLWRLRPPAAAGGYLITCPAAQNFPSETSHPVLLSSCWLCLQCPPQPSLLPWPHHLTL